MYLFFFKLKIFLSDKSAAETGGIDPPAVYGDFVATMFDASSFNQDFQTIFVELVKGFIARTDIDGLRLDAAKHVTEVEKSLSLVSCVFHFLLS